MHSPHTRYAVSLGVAGIFACGLIIVLSATLAQPQPANAEDIVALCEKESSRERCYEKTIPTLYPEKSIPEIFTLIREVRDLDASYQFCHVLAHLLGEVVVAEDAEAWLDAIPLNPADGLCSNGFIHGVIVGRFRNDVLDAPTVTATVPEFKKACEPREGWQASPLDQAICYHGLGHLFMFITNAEIDRALAVCDAVGVSPSGNFLRVCYEGVFMQIYQPLEPDDFALIELLPEKPSVENYRRMCAFYAKDAEGKGACLREAWPLFRENIVSGEEVAAFCSGQPNREETEKCYQTSAAIVGRMSLNDTDAAVEACLKFPAASQKLCFVTVAQSFLEEDRTDTEPAIAICTRAAAPLDTECLRELATRISYIFGSGNSYGADFCAALPANVQNYCHQ